MMKVVQDHNRASKSATNRTNNPVGLATLQQAAQVSHIQEDHPQEHERNSNHQH